MSTTGGNPGRRIVTCDGCGTPYTAVERGEGLVLVGPADGACENCRGTDFSRLRIAETA